MRTTSPEALALLGRAAKLRAEGQSWDDTARQLAVGAEELRRLAFEHSRDYDRLLRKARNEVLREAVNLAVSTLRELLHSDDPDISRGAATTLTRYTLARMRQGLSVDGRRLARPAPRKITVKAEKPRKHNASESPQVPNQKPDEPAKKVAQSQSQSQSQPQSQPPASTPASPPPVTPAAPANPATPVATNSTITPHLRELRRRLMLNDFVRGGVAHPLGKDDRLDQEVARLVDGLPTDTRVDDAPPG